MSCKISFHTTNTNIGQSKVTYRNQMSHIHKQRSFDTHNRPNDYVAITQHIGIKRTTAYAIIQRAQ